MHVHAAHLMVLNVCRLLEAITAVYAADLAGAAAGCLLLIPLLDGLGAPGAILAAADPASRSGGAAAALALPGGTR